MRATFVFVALAIVANAADARVLKDEALAFVNALATKYDCHNEEANLVDTLGTILIKNEDRQKASSQKCADDVSLLCQQRCWLLLSFIAGVRKLRKPYHQLPKAFA